MSLVAMLHELETLFVQYADTAEKDVLTVGTEVKEFLLEKITAAENAKATNSNPIPAAQSAAASIAGGVQANPTTSGPAAASAGSQVSGAATTGKSS